MEIMKWKVALMPGFAPEGGLQYTVTHKVANQKQFDFKVVFTMILCAPIFCVCKFIKQKTSLGLYAWFVAIRTSDD